MPKYDLKRRNLSSEKNSVRKVKLNLANQHKSSPCGPPQYKPVVKGTFCTIICNISIYYFYY